ncbi:MAG: methyltransferase domain-containing protein [Candidatus Riflebacteria bacterium]|nr:methyltransferase domain-containing protein [Candidatus Riflebacteria bacterium]
MTAPAIYPAEGDQKIQEQFTKRAPIYDDVSAWIADEGMLEAIVDQCRVGHDAVLLDVCCGTGAVGGAFKGLVGRRVGLDLTAKMLETARERLDEVHQGSCEALPFPDASFGLVVNRQALHFVPDPAKAIREMFRVLEPGGQLLLTHRIPYGATDAAWWEKVNRAKQPLARNFFVEEVLAELIHRPGFQNLTVTDYFLWESICAWMDSPEARAQSEEVFRLYREAPPEVVELRGITVSETEIRDRWRWAIFSAFKPA